MPGKRQASSPRAVWPFFVVPALLAAAAYAAYVWQQRRPSGADPLEQTADLISDERLVFGGAPRPGPGAGAEVQCTVLKNQGYIVGYSESRRDPLWAAYRVFHTEHPFDIPRPAGFATDTRTAARVRETDYAKSGYDRGHMAPNSDIMREWGKEAQLETFLLSNICPQAPELNERVWERLEADERKYADTCAEVWVIDGPIFAELNGGQTPRLASGIAVPSAFYKILIDEEGQAGGKPRIFSVIMPQEVKGTELPQQFLTTVAEIERETHLEFFWKMDPQTRGELEGTKWKMW